MIYEEITEDILNEKLITYGNRKPYGQVVFVAGGAGSGKGFAIENFLDSSSFKIRDVDEMKKQLQILNRLGKIDINTIIKKHGRNIKPKDIDLINKIQDEGFKLQNLNLKNPDHVYALHILVDAMGIKDKTLHSLLSGKNNPETLPNVLFDITAKKITSITSVIADLKKAGYKADNIHLTWILTNYVTAMVNNKNRARMVPEDILLQTHEGASNTIWGIVTKALPKGMNGRIDVILNNPEHTVFYTDDDGKTINGKVKGFKSLPLKKAKGGIYAEAVWKKLLFSWVKGNAPDTITANMKESVNEAYIVLHSPKKGVKPVTTAAYKDKKDAEKWAKELGGITMIVQKKIKGIDEAQQVNSKSVDVLRRAVQKINKKYKVQVSKIGPTKGEVEIELGDGNHPDSDYHAIDKLVSKLGIKKYSIFNESVNEAKDNLYLQLHKKYAKQIKGLKAKKIKKLTDLVSVQRRSMEDRKDYFDMDSKKKKELSAEYNEERKLFKKYIGGNYSVMLPKGTEKLSESVVSEDSPESAHPQGSDKLTNRTVVMDMLDVISHMKFGPDYHKLSTSQKKEVHKEAIKGYLINDKPFKE